MSGRWRNAGLILAVIVLVATLADPGGNATIAGLPTVVQAALNALATFVAVWLWEGIYHGLLIVGRLLFPARRPTDRD
jgi:hypothetical protein